MVQPTKPCPSIPRHMGTIKWTCTQMPRPAMTRVAEGVQRKGPVVVVGVPIAWWGAGAWAGSLGARVRVGRGRGRGNMSVGRTSSRRRRIRIASRSRLPKLDDSCFVTPGSGTLFTFPACRVTQSSSARTTDGSAIAGEEVSSSALHIRALVAVADGRCGGRRTIEASARI
jgi:hypothetical protein